MAHFVQLTQEEMFICVISRLLTLFPSSVLFQRTLQHRTICVTSGEDKNDTAPPPHFSHTFIFSWEMIACQAFQPPAPLKKKSEQKAEPIKKKHLQRVGLNFSKSK